MEGYHITHVYRESNMAADAIANVVVRCQEKMTWQGDGSLSTNVISCIDYNLINEKEGVIIREDGRT